MQKSKLNGYSLEIAKIKTRYTRDVTLIDDKGKRFHFNMIKQDDEWVLRDPSAIPAFIRKLEKTIAKII